MAGTATPLSSQGPPPGAVATPIDTSAGGPPPGAVATPIAGAGGPPSGAVASPLAGLTDNPNGEGTYAMKGPKGDTLQVPYSKVGSEARQAGYQLTGGQTWYGAPQGEAARYFKDYAADPQAQRNTMDTYKAVQDPGQGAELGAARGAVLTAAGLAHIARKATGTTASTTGTEKGLKEFGEGGDTGAEEAGKFIESAGEFLMGDEALKGLSYVDRLKQVMPALKVLEKSPLLAKIVDAAIQQGTVGGVQAAAHGASPTDALETAAATGGTGGLLTGALGKIGDMIATRAPAVENIGGEGVQTLSSQRPGIGPRGDVTPAEVPKVEQAQQAAAPRVFQNIAQRATQRALDEANVGRAIPRQITNPARLLEAPAGAEPYKFTIEGPGATSEETPAGNEPRKKQIGTQYVPGKGSGSAPNTEDYPHGTFMYGDEAPLPHINDQEPFTGPTHKEPVFQYLTSLKPGEAAGDTSVTGGGNLVAATPEAAQMHLSRLNDLVDHPPAGMTPEQTNALTAARDSLQDQMDMYHSYQRTLPNFAPIDSARAAASVGHFGEAQDQLENAAKPIYQKIDAATDGEFGKLNRMKSAAAKRGDFQAKYDLEDQIGQLIDTSKAITPAERQQATRLWSQSKVLGGFHDVIERAANVSEDYSSQVSGGRVISGTKLQNGLKGLIDHYGTDRLESVVGKDGMENMTRIADLLKTQPKSKISMLTTNIYHNLAHGKVGAALGIGLGTHLLGGYEGALAGGATGAYAERMVLRYIATNPRAGQLFDYGIRNDVAPKVAAGLIAAEIEREHAQPQPTPDKSQ